MKKTLFPLQMPVFPALLRLLGILGLMGLAAAFGFSALNLSSRHGFPVFPSAGSAGAVKALRVEQVKKPYGDEAPGKDCFRVTAVLRSGGEEECGGYDLSVIDGSRILVSFGGTEETAAYESIPFVRLEVSCRRAFHEGEAPPGSADIQVDAVFEDGSKRPVPFELGEADADGRQTVLTEYGDAVLEAEEIPVTNATAEYVEPVRIGEKPDRKACRMTLYFADGFAREVDDFEASGMDEPLLSRRVLTFCSGGHEAQVAVEPVPLDSAHPVLSSAAKAGEPLPLSRIACIYRDGFADTVGPDEVEFLTFPGRKLSAGENVYRFRRFGQEMSFTVNAKTSLNVDDAKRLLADELAGADYSHVSDNIFVTVNEYTEGPAHYFLAHVVINDPSQLQSEMAHGSYGGERELPTEAAGRLGWVIGVNGSNFDWGTGRPVYAGAVIKDRTVMEGTRTNGMEICLMSNGVLFSPDAGVDPHKLVLSDVTDSWSCGDTLLVDDGKAVNVGIQSEQYRYPRTAVGMVQPCEYYLLVSGSGNYEGGMTYDEVRSVLMDHGCTFGKCMDGGGSSSLVLDGKLLNTPAVGARERPVCDFLYFTEF